MSRSMIVLATTAVQEQVAIARAFKEDHSVEATTTESVSGDQYPRSRTAIRLGLTLLRLAGPTVLSVGVSVLRCCRTVAQFHTFRILVAIPTGQTTNAVYASPSATHGRPGHKQRQVNERSNACRSLYLIARRHNMTIDSHHHSLSILLAVAVSLRAKVFICAGSTS